MRRLIASSVMLLCWSSSAVADLRTIDVPADKGWKHAESGIILTRSLADLARESLQDSGTQELDISAQFRSRDKATLATIYIFRPAVNVVPIWFEQSRGQIEQGDMFGLKGHTINLRPVTFSVSGSTNQSGLKVVYPVSVPDVKSTALAMVPVGEWLFAVRISSPTLDATAMSAELDAVLNAVRFPAESGSAPAAKLVEMCVKPLTFQKAKLAKRDEVASTMDALFGAALSAQMKKQSPEKMSMPASFCKDQSSTKNMGIYRPDNSEESYLMAIGDAGVSISVGPALSGLIGDHPTPRYSVTLEELDRSVVFSSFDRLPPPAQVGELVESGKAISSTTRGSTNTTIYMSPSK